VNTLKPQFPFSIAAWFDIPDFSNNNILIDLTHSPNTYHGAWVLINSNQLVNAAYGDGGTAAF